MSGDMAAILRGEHEAPRGNCRVCGREYQLTWRGYVRKHRPQEFGAAKRTGPPCSGSGMYPPDEEKS